MLIGMTKKRTIAPGTPFSPGEPPSPCRQIQRGKNELVAETNHFIYDEIPAVDVWKSGITSRYPTLGPAGPASPLAPSRPLKPCAQNQSATSGQSPPITSGENGDFCCYIVLRTHSVSLDAGESRGSGESASALQEENKRYVNNYVQKQHANASCMVMNLY